MAIELRSVGRLCVRSFGRLVIPLSSIPSQFVVRWSVVAVASPNSRAAVTLVVVVVIGLVVLLFWLTLTSLSLEWSPSLFPLLLSSLPSTSSSLCVEVVVLRVVVSRSGSRRRRCCR